MSTKHSSTCALPPTDKHKEKKVTAISMKYVCIFATIVAVNSRLRTALLNSRDGMCTLLSIHSIFFFNLCLAKHFEVGLFIGHKIFRR